MIIPIRRIFTPGTQLALSTKVQGYLHEDGAELAQALRFDIGKNSDGFSPLIHDVLDESDLVKLSVENLVDYPDNQYRLLRDCLSELHGIAPESFVLSAGLEPMIDIIARMALQPGDHYLFPVPNFFIFEEYASRLGATPLLVPLQAAHEYRWNHATTDELCEGIAQFKPKLLWISNPINPTGQLISLDNIEIIAEQGKKYGCLVVIDEAYGEYTDNKDTQTSACRLLKNNHYLMVLRTFSKIYGLPSIRVGYMMSSSPEVRAAVALYTPIFPFSWFSLYIAQIAAVDQEYVEVSREQTNARRIKLLSELAAIEGITVYPSQTNVFLLSCAQLKGKQLSEELMRRHILVSDLDGSTGLENSGCVRVTVRNEKDNAVFAAACHEIAALQKQGALPC